MIKLNDRIITPTRFPDQTTMELGDFQPGISAVALTEEVLMDARQAVERAKQTIPPRNEPMAPLVVACDAMLEAAELLHKRLLASFG